MANLLPTAISYESKSILAKLQSGELVFNIYQADGFQIFEAALLCQIDIQKAWESFQRFPSIWENLKTTGSHERRVIKKNLQDPEIAVGNVIQAEAIVFGVPIKMENTITHLVYQDMFHLSVRALGGRFESEVEAKIQSCGPNQTLLVWRQGYPQGNILSYFTSHVLRGREGKETKAVMSLWAKEVESR